MLDKVLNTPATSSSTSPSVFVSVNISLFHRIKFAETYLVGDVIFFIVLFCFVLFCCFFFRGYREHKPEISSEGSSSKNWFHISTGHGKICTKFV